MTKSALTSRRYLLYLIGNTISLHGLWVYRVALGWHAWQLSESEFWVGLVAFTQFAPAVVLGPLFGVLADRFDRRHASLLINSLSVVNMLVLGMLAAQGYVDIRVLALVSLVQGTLDGAHMPVRMSVVPNLVDKPQLESAIATTSIAFNLSRFVGPALAGFVIAKFGVAAAFVVNGVSYLAFIAAMLVIRLNPATGQRPVRRHVFHEMREGIAYALSRPRIRALLFIMAVASIFGRGALEMLPAFAAAVFAGGSSALAALTSALGAGAVVAGLILSRGVHWLRVRTVRAAVVAGGVLIALLGVVEQFWLAVVIVGLLGVILSICGIGSQILMQTLVDDELRGRVSSFWGMIAFGGTALGSLLVGSSATVLGLQNVVLIAGIACSVAAALTVFLARGRASAPGQ